ncbi:MAG: hypothetical protein ACTSWN_02555 [Promethearchaeota archaeon]
MEKRKMIFLAITVPLFLLITISFVYWMVDLNTRYPGQYGFILDPNDLMEQVNGLTYTLTTILAFFYLMCGVYLVMEAFSTKIEIQAKFHKSLAQLFMLIGLAQFIVVLYSIFKMDPYNFAQSDNAFLQFFVENDPNVEIPVPRIVPGFGIINRGDTLFYVIIVVLSFPLIMYNIEKYIKNSKRFILTKILIGGTAIGIISIVSAYIEFLMPVKTQSWSWWEPFSIALLLYEVLCVAIMIIGLPAIYFTLAAQTSGNLKKNATTIAIGYVITFLSLLLHAFRSEIDFPLNWLVFIIGNIVGAMILMIGYLRSTY